MCQEKACWCCTGSGKQDIQLCRNQAGCTGTKRLRKRLDTDNPCATDPGVASASGFFLGKPTSIISHAPYDLLHVAPCKKRSTCLEDFVLRSRVSFTVCQALAPKQLTIYETVKVTVCAGSSLADSSQHRAGQGCLSKHACGPHSSQRTLTASSFASKKVFST